MVGEVSHSYDRSFELSPEDLVTLSHTLSAVEEMSEATFEREKAEGKSDEEALKTSDETKKIADTAAKLSQMYQPAKADMSGTALDLAEYAPLGIGAIVEGGRDMYGVYISGDRELRPVVDKWRNFGLIAAVCGKGGKKIAGEVLEIAGSIEKKVIRKAERLHPMVKPINERMPINAKFAGKMFDMSKLSPELQRKYPHGVPFTAAGHPDFSRYSIRKVQIKMSGNNEIDKKLADRVAGFIGSNKRPEGYMWHHHEDGKTMLLVPKDLHEVVRHTGGIAVANAIKK
jgi:hypothetical protein